MTVKNVEKLEKSRVAVTVEVGAEEFEAAVAKAYAKARGKLSIPGVRPGKASHQPAAQTILSRLAARTVADITGEQPDTAPASTDANVPLSLGIPADCVGAVRGALLHTRDEWIDKDSLVDGLSVILSLMTEARHAEAQTR